MGRLKIREIYIYNSQNLPLQLPLISSILQYFFSAFTSALILWSKVEDISWLCQINKIITIITLDEIWFSQWEDDISETWYFWDPIFLRSDISETWYFWDLIFLRPNISETQYFWDPIFLGPDITGTQYVWDPIFLRIDISETRYFQDLIILRPNISENRYFWCLIFLTILDYFSLFTTISEFFVTFLMDIFGCLFWPHKIYSRSRSFEHFLLLFLSILKDQISLLNGTLYSSPKCLLWTFAKNFMLGSQLTQNWNFIQKNDVFSKIFTEKNIFLETSALALKEHIVRHHLEKTRTFYLLREKKTSTFVW